MDENKSHLVFAMMHFLEKELLRSDLTPDAKESLEVGIQCLENVYEIFSNDQLVKAKYVMPATLPEIFQAGLEIKMADYKPKEITAEEKAKADKHKAEGNENMKVEKYSDAVVDYTRAITLDDTNAVYFCNRAAAYSKLLEHPRAIEDCVSALLIDPKYSKAYGRKGLAHTAQGQYGDAKQSFEKALEYDPDNQSYKKNLEVAEQKLSEQGAGAPGGGMMPGGMPAGFPGMPGFGGGFGGMNFAQMLNNPALINMATQMMSNPQMQQMMSNMMGSLGGGEEGAPPMADLLQAGQQLAQQICTTNPELVEQMRGTLAQAEEGAQENSEQPPNQPEGDQQ